MDQFKSTEMDQFKSTENESEFDKSCYIDRLYDLWIYENFWYSKIRGKEPTKHFKTLMEEYQKFRKTEMKNRKRLSREIRITKKVRVTSTFVTPKKFRTLRKVKSDGKLRPQRPKFRKAKSDGKIIVPLKENRVKCEVFDNYVTPKKFRTLRKVKSDCKLRIPRPKFRKAKSDGKIIVPLKENLVKCEVFDNFSIPRKIDYPSFVRDSKKVCKYGMHM